MTMKAGIRNRKKRVQLIRACGRADSYSSTHETTSRNMWIPPTNYFLLVEIRGKTTLLQVHTPQTEREVECHAQFSKARFAKTQISTSQLKFLVHFVAIKFRPLNWSTSQMTYYIYKNKNTLQP